ncbi:MAG: repressor LexA [Microgenomates group bacterium Gr01-1014_16]|nr:MAG: repressor LexA [Microgenomates group bacterium Gr01-1014_16]
MNVNMEKPITPKQKIVFEFIKSFSKKNGFAPSLQEIADYLNKSLSTAQHFVAELHKKGYLQKSENVARSISTLGDTFKQIFKLGYIAAGNPIEPIENPEPIDVPTSFLEKPGNYYALEVKGNSMIEDNILDGDTVVIRHTQIAEDGDRIVAITEDGATLKVFRNKNGKTYLEPRNNNLSAIYPKQLEIRGKYCGLIRKGE